MKCGWRICQGHLLHAIASGKLHGNAVWSFQGIMSSDWKFHWPLQRRELQQQTQTHQACSWNTPLSESQNLGVTLDSYCCLSLFLFISNPIPFLIWIPCNSDLTGVMITLISGTLSLLFPNHGMPSPHPKLFPGKELLVFQDSTQVSSSPGNLSLPPEAKSGAASLCPVALLTLCSSHNYPPWYKPSPSNTVSLSATPLGLMPLSHLCLQHPAEIRHYWAGGTIFADWHTFLICF